MDESRPELRIGDRERRAVDAHLQQAHADGVLTLTEYDERAAQCWAARTRSDLDALVQDLPPYRPEPGAEAPTVAVPPEKADSGCKTPGQRLISGMVGIALAGAALYLGSQVVTADDGVSIMGSRQITVAPDQDRVEVGMVFGSVKVVVPDDARARTTGAVVFGSTECELACTGPGREVVVDVTGAFGSVDVMRPGEPDLDDEDEDEDED